jgi:hypothetical protein
MLPGSRTATTTAKTMSAMRRAHSLILSAVSGRLARMIMPAATGTISMMRSTTATRLGSISICSRTALVSGFIEVQNANNRGVTTTLNNVEIAVMLTDVATLP